MEGQRRLERELLAYSLGRWDSWRGKNSKQGKTWPNKWPLQSARWIRCNGLVISQATESHWASSAIFSDIWPCLLVIFWLGDLKRSGNLQQKRALSSVLCLPYHNGMYYGNCGYTFIWSKRMHNTFLLQILVERGAWANARLGWRRGRDWSWKRFLMEHQVQLRISLLGFGNSIIIVFKFLITES